MAVQDGVNRRDFFLRAGAMGMLGAMPELAIADGGAGFAGQAAGAGQAASNMVHEVAQPSAEDLAPPTHSVNFAVCGMSHDHIYGMVDAITRGGGKLVAAYGSEDIKVARFTKRYPGVKMVKTEAEILDILQ